MITDPIQKLIKKLRKEFPLIKGRTIELHVVSALKEAREDGYEEGIGHRIKFEDDGYARAIKAQALASYKAELVEKIEGIAEKYSTSSGARNMAEEVLNLIENKQ